MMGAGPQFDITPPQSMEAEKAYLGSILIDPEALTDTRHKLGPDDFFYLRHTHIYAAMLRLADQEMPVDPELLADELQTARQLESCGNRSYLIELTNCVPTSVHAEYYADIVLRASIRRRLLKAADDIKAMASDTASDLDTVMAASERLITAAVEYGADNSNSVNLSDALHIQWDEISAVSDGQVTPARLPARHIEAHKIIRGYLNGAVYTLAARPGVGKSSWMHSEAAHIARHYLARAAEQGGLTRRVVIYTLEMPERQVTNAIVSIEVGIPYTVLDDRVLSQAEVNQLSRAAGSLSKLPIDIVDDLTCYEDIEADIRKRQRRGEFGTAFIDQLNLLDTRTAFKGESADRQRINFIMPRYKRLAMAVDAPLFMLHQVNREGDDEPKLKHLKESGRVEEQSDAVIFLYRDMDAAADIDPLELQDTTVIVAKNRHGRLGRFTIAFRGINKAFVSRATPRQVNAAPQFSGNGNHRRDIHE